jgi:hypothetical protein
MFARIGKSTGWIGLGVGLLLGLTFAGFLPNTPLHASSTDRLDTFAVATGACDDQVEAIYFLDFLTGHLTAAVLSRQTYKFQSFFERSSVNTDLGVDASKGPHYLMVTGRAELLRTTGRSGIGPSFAIVYVAEVTSGKVAAYAIPWTSTSWISGRQQTGPMKLLDVGRFRSAGAGGGASKEKE